MSLQTAGVGFGADRGGIRPANGDLEREAAHVPAQHRLPRLPALLPPHLGPRPRHDVHHQPPHTDRDCRGRRWVHGTNITLKRDQGSHYFFLLQKVNHHKGLLESIQGHATCSCRWVDVNFIK